MQYPCNVDLRDAFKNGKMTMIGVAIPLKNTWAYFLAVIATALGGWDWLIQTLFIFMIIDFFTGSLAALKDGESNSNSRNWGIVKKVMCWVVVYLAARLDSGLPVYFAGVKNVFIRDAVCLGYVLYELESNIENLDRLGVPFPRAVRRAFKYVKSLDDSLYRDNKSSEVDKDE